MFSYEVYDMPETICEDTFDAAMAFAANFLGIDSHITIEFEDLPQYHFGACDHDEFEGEQETTVTLSENITQQEAIQTLFHELVHAKQYLDGRLEGGFQLRWMGETYDCDYQEQPWEIEAFALEEEMMNTFYS